MQELQGFSKGTSLGLVPPCTVGSQGIEGYSCCAGLYLNHNCKRAGKREQEVTSNVEEDKSVL